MTHLNKKETSFFMTRRNKYSDVFLLGVVEVKYKMIPVIYIQKSNALRDD